MAMIPMERGGLKSTSTWSAAVSNATSVIVVAISANIGGSIRECQIIIPKDRLTATLKYFYGTGGYFSSSASMGAYVCASQSTMDSYAFYFNGTAQTVDSITYYYD